ncbi:MAG: AAA family ATPase, partial [Ruminococcaceae bacterium]|nr:AAA family ATPase [Oscillospiraceae bacterium]
GYLHTTPCTCYKDKKRNYLYQAANLTPVMEQQSFERFRLDYYSKEPVSNGHSAYDYVYGIYKDCRNFVQLEQYKTGVNLFLYGDPGLGKTFLCSCIAQDLLNQEVPVLYQTAYRLFTVLEDARFKKDEMSEELARQFYEIPVLIIDDLGTEFVTSYTSAVLFDLLNTRIQNKKSTVISSNLTLSQMKEQYSERVQSRIFGEYKLLKFYGTDIRKK